MLTDKHTLIFIIWRRNTGGNKQEPEVFNERVSRIFLLHMPTKWKSHVLGNHWELHFQSIQRLFMLLIWAVNPSTCVLLRCSARGIRSLVHMNASFVDVWE